ncbi:predicted membrane protein [Longilinea arvoryzae]|uniref:Predicted membrane protein n=1 Tax=Longilinea arvoryzae TaxID=360412 RepID=A0A0S7BNQ0_9CHLR|nr:AzlD domain-containing protein [Longilinea arvoryzae]GAP15585.1 predicted membrane protein [Longilinea arvoryzae]
MSVRPWILMLILASAAVTFIPRVLPLALLSRFNLPKWLIRWLGYVPIAVLAALLAQSVLLANGSIDLSFHNLALVAVVPTLLVALRTRSLIWTVLTGVASMALLRLFLG